MSKNLSPVIRQKILDAAGAAFYNEGYQAIGVDALAERAGVSKMTLYRHFPSKDELIVAVLNAFDQNSTAQYAALMAVPTTPRAKLLAIFEWIAKRARQPDCHGCAFQNSAAEYPEPSHPVHTAARANKRGVRAAYLAQARALGARDAEMLADQLLLLTDGAWASSRMWGAAGPARHIVGAAEALIDAQLNHKH